MSRRGDAACKWTCTGCGVSASRIDGKPTPLPDNWVSSAEGCFCLTCRRHQAGEAALDAAPSDSGRDARVKLRRTGVIEFEVRRSPDRTDGSIAKACRTSASTVAAARRHLRLREGPPPGTDRDMTAARDRMAGRA
ncbi:MAG TPA: hypothetical protein VIS95_04535 [Solirubrobacterales bacterium]